MKLMRIGVLDFSFYIIKNEHFRNSLIMISVMLSWNSDSEKNLYDSVQL